MDKLQIIISVGLISFAAAAQAQQYVRKQMRPDFFVPEKEFNRQEKLPSFPTLQSGAIKVTDEGVMVKVADKSKDEEAENLPKGKARKLRMQDLRLKPMEQEEVVAVISPAEASDEPEYRDEDDNFDADLADDLSDDPQYIAAQESYKEDLQVMKRSRRMPENRELDADLQKMNDDASFAVE